MEDQLTAKSGSGSQTATQSPQTASPGAAGGTKSSAVQPGTARALLTEGQAGGVSLNQNSLTTVSLAPAATAQTAAPAPKPATAQSHDVNPALFVIPVVLVLVAAAMIWVTRRSIKNTTQ